MTVTEFQELDEIKTLVARGAQTGVLSHADIASATAELDLDDADRDELKAWIEAQEIELIEDDPSAPTDQVLVSTMPSFSIAKASAASCASSWLSASIFVK